VYETSEKQFDPIPSIDSVADPDQESTAFLPPWIRDDFFSGSRIQTLFGEIFLHFLQHRCYVLFMKLGYSL
jgi:hypothetical protein